MKAERTRAKDLPEYENPPVTEVVCGVQFKPLENFRMPHFGLFWKQIEKQYPAFQETAPLLPTVERYGLSENQEPQLQFAFNDLPLPRIWFLDSKGTGLHVRQFSEGHEIRRRHRRGRGSTATEN